MLLDKERTPTRDRVYERAYAAVFAIVSRWGASLDVAALRVMDSAAREGLLEPEEGVNDAQEDGKA